MTIPVLDMRDQRTDKQGFAQQLGETLHTFGFVRLTGHGVTAKAIHEADEAGRKFWALPQAVKDRYSQEPYKVGIRVGYGHNAETALSSTKVDIKEEWGINACPEPPYNAREMLNGVLEVPHFGDKILRLYDQFEKCAARVMRSIAIYGELGERTFDPWLKDSASYMRLLNYPQKGNAAGHLDFNMLTLLHVSEPGLIVRDRKGRQHHVTTEPGELILNGGMQLGLITNDHLRPSWHEVKADIPRTSIPFFLHPRRDVVLTPVGKFAQLNPGKVPPYFPPRDEKGRFAIETGEFNAQRLKEIYQRAPGTVQTVKEQLAL